MNSIHLIPLIILLLVVLIGVQFSRYTDAEKRAFVKYVSSRKRRAPLKDSRNSLERSVSMDSRISLERPVSRDSFDVRDERAAILGGRRRLKK